MIDCDMKSDKHVMNFSINKKTEVNTIKKRCALGEKDIFPMAGSGLFHDSDSENNSLNSKVLTLEVKRFSESFKEKLLESVTFPFTDRVFIYHQHDKETSAAPLPAQIPLDVSCTEKTDFHDSKQNLVNKNILVLPDNGNISMKVNPGNEYGINEKYIDRVNNKLYDDYNDTMESYNFSAKEKGTAKRSRGRPRVQFRKTHPCNVCGKVFTRKTHLTTHLRIHSDEKPFRCSLCSKRFRDNSVLIKHIRIHTRDKPYSCSVCKKAFTQKGNMDRHYRRHTNEKPFECSVCANGFTTKSHLERHFRIHLDEKPFTCELCEKSFRQKSHLMRHVLVHSREKPYACNLCDKRFRQEQHVTRHKMTHIKELITNILSKQYVSNSVISIAT